MAGLFLAQYRLIVPGTESRVRTQEVKYQVQKLYEPGTQKSILLKGVDALMLPPRKIHKPELIQPVPRLRVFKQFGILQMHIILYNHHMIIVIQI
jgi:hypothetical protein